MHDPPVFLGFIHKIFQLELATAKHAKAKLAGKVVQKSYVCKRTAAITLNYSIKDIQNDIHQIIYIYENRNWTD